MAPKGETTRPTLDAHRETLFNVVSNALGHEMKTVVDFFSGSGALALEAISRGADKAILFEHHRPALDCIKKNMASLGMNAKSIELVPVGQLERWPDLLRTRLNAESVDTVFCDPPYNHGLVERVFHVFGEHVDLFSENCLFVAEVGRQEVEPKSPGWELFKTKERGVTKLLFYRKSRDLG